MTESPAPKELRASKAHSKVASKVDPTKPRAVEAQPEPELKPEQDTAAAEAEHEPEQKPVSDMTPAEVEAYYDENNLAAKAQGVMSEYELDIVERRGQILSTRRQQAELDGQNAALTKVRRIVTTHVNQYGRAQFLTQLLADNFRQLHREDVASKVTITIQSGGVAVEMGFEDIQKAYNQNSNSQTVEFNRLVGQLLALLKNTANMRKIRECKVDGRDYTAMCSDITWKAVVDELSREHAG